MDVARAASILRRLGHARATDGALLLPEGLTAAEALEAVRTFAETFPAPATPPVKTQSRAAGPGCPRMHIDGGSRGNPGPAGLGVVLIGPDGEVVEQVHRYLGRATNNVAEYQALLAGLDRARALGWTELAVFSDSELLVRQIQGRYQVKHPGLRPLYMSARLKLAGFRRVEFRHVPRELNAEADALANRGIDEGLRAEAAGSGTRRRGESE